MSFSEFLIKQQTRPHDILLMTKHVDTACKKTIPVYTALLRKIRAYLGLDQQNSAIILVRLALHDIIFV